MSPSDLSGHLVRTAGFFQEERIPYMLVDGFAVGFWAAPRATLDLDFLLGGGWAKITDTLRRGFERGIFSSEPEPLNLKRLRILRLWIKDRESIITVDCLVADRFGEQALHRRKAVTVQGQKVHLASPEDLILLKLLSRRPQDLSDAEAIAGQQSRTLDRAYLFRNARQMGVVRKLRKLIEKQ